MTTGRATEFAFLWLPVAAMGVGVGLYYLLPFATTLPDFGIFVGVMAVAYVLGVLATAYQHRAHAQWVGQHQ
jgi:membrane protein implicated in regulation of membrane protease activity